VKLKTIFAAAAAVGGLFCGVATAHAQTLKFTWVEPGLGGGTISFLQDSNPTPIAYDSSYTQVAISDFAGSLGPYPAGGPTNGPYTGPYSSIYWYPSGNAGGFELYNDSTGFLDVSVLGDQDFTGPDQAPVFAPGVFSGHDYYSNIDGTLTVTAVNVGGVPEPAAWAMLLIGLGAIGAVMRTTRRRETAAMSAA
jgi:hypothetical protein